MIQDKQYLNPDNPVYISYTGANTDVVQDFILKLDELHIYHRDSISEDIDEISEFEELIGDGKIVVLFYSPDYFKSYHCMNEYSLVRKSEEDKKIFTVRCVDFQFDENFIRTLRKHWGGEWADIKSRRYKSLTKVEKAAFDNNCYVEAATKYSVDMLKEFFSDKKRKDINSLANQLYRLFKPEDGQGETFRFNAMLSYHFPTFAVRDNIVERDKEVEELKSLFEKRRFVNMIGLGGCGKSTISEYFFQRYHKEFGVCTSVVINTDYYKDFINRFREPLQVDYQYEDESKKEKGQISIKKTYDAIIERIDGFASGVDKPNLIVIDINETADYEPIRWEMNQLKKHLKRWKILVVSRVKMCPNITLFEPINVTNIDSRVLCKIFFSFLGGNKHSYYQNFFKQENLFKLFGFLFNLPLLVEQLAYFLSVMPEMTYQDILRELKINEEQFNEKFTGRSIPDSDKYDFINDYLSTLVIFSSLDELTKTGRLLRDIVRHFVIWPSKFYDMKFIKSFIPLIDSERPIEEGLSYLVDKCILSTKTEEHTYQMHGLIAQSCRKQIYTEQDNREFRDYTRYLQIVDKPFSNCNYWFSRDEESAALDAIFKSFSVIIPNDNKEEEYMLLKAHNNSAGYGKKIYEHVLKVKFLKHIVSDSDLYIQLTSKNFIENDVDVLYYGWLAKNRDYSFNLQNFTRTGNQFIDDYVEKMVAIKGGSFDMGSFVYESEKPIHRVSVNSFMIGQLQVSRGLWKAVMGEQNDPSDFKRDDDCPIDCVSWYDILAFIMKFNELTNLSFRLPTEAEWEFAFSRVETNNHNAFGLTWNLWEWCQDWYDPNYYQKCVENPNLSVNPYNNNCFSDMNAECRSVEVFDKSYFVETKAGRVLRGGSWPFCSRSHSLFYRNDCMPDDYRCNYGFRLALSCLKNNK